MIKIVDKKCSICGKVYEDVFDDEIEKCNCGGNLERLFSFRKFPEYPEGWYENFDHEPVYIKDRADYYKKCKQYGVHPVEAKREYRLARKRKHFAMGV